ncbi:MAG: hypothetical protein WKF84_25120 [Pyrinomonadaceae bacterium]
MCLITTPKRLRDLYKRVRPDAIYQQTLTLLRRAGERRDRERRGMLTKSGIMVGPRRDLR